MARRGLELLLIITCVALLVTLFKSEELPHSDPDALLQTLEAGSAVPGLVEQSSREFTPKEASIGGIALGMSKVQVESILGPGPHDQWPLAGLNYTDEPPVYVSYDDYDRVTKVAGLRLELDGHLALTHPVKLEQMVASLGEPNETSRGGDRCGGGWQVHSYHLQQVTVRTGMGPGAPMMLEQTRPAEWHAMIDQQ